MKKKYSFPENLHRFYRYYGWFCTTVLAAGIVTLILMVSSIVTPFLNSIIWGM